MNPALSLLIAVNGIFDLVDVFIGLPLEASVAGIPVAFLIDAIPIAIFVIRMKKAAKDGDQKIMEVIKSNKETVGHLLELIPGLGAIPFRTIFIILFGSIKEKIGAVSDLKSSEGGEDNNQQEPTPDAVPA